MVHLLILLFMFCSLLSFALHNSLYVSFIFSFTSFLLIIWTIFTPLHLQPSDPSYLFLLYSFFFYLFIYVFTFQHTSFVSFIHITAFLHIFIALASFIPSFFSYLFVHHFWQLSLPSCDQPLLFYIHTTWVLFLSCFIICYFFVFSQSEIMSLCLFFPIISFSPAFIASPSFHPFYISFRPIQN